MALTSVFYDGPSTDTDRAKNRAGEPDYGVYGADDFQVIPNGSVPFSVKVRAGRAHGWGVTDTAATDQTIMCDAPANGVTRWDLIAVRRNWQPLLGGPSTLVAIKGGAFTDIPADRKVGPGIEDDQPIALVGWKGGQSAPFQIIDLRCWAHNGGMEVVSEIAFEYLGAPGACVKFGQDTYRFTHEGNGVWGWNPDIALQMDQVPPGYVPIFKLGRVALRNPENTANRTNQHGDGYYYFPEPFPNQMLSCVVMTANDPASWSTSTENFHLNYNSVYSNRFRLSVRVYDKNGAAVGNRVGIFATYIAVGY